MVGALAPLGEGKFPSPPGTQLPPPLSQGGTLAPHRLILLAAAGVGEDMTSSWPFPSFFKLML